MALAAAVAVGLALLAWFAAPGAPALAYEEEMPPESSQTTLAVFLPLLVTSRVAGPETVELVDFTYRLQEGDDLAMLALVWGVDSELMACVTRSGQEPLSGLRPGTLLMIAGPRYRCHTAGLDETVEGIAADYGVTADVLLAEPWNQLTSAAEALEPGRRLLILDGVRPDLASLRASQPVTATQAAPQPTATPQSIQPWPYGDGEFIWPVQGGVISQGFRAGHRAMDIAAPIGAPVYAAGNGIVISAGYSRDGYGGRVIIDHQIDYVTLYAHLSQALVEEGEIVQKGQIIGYVGSTGNSTGPHIHFELRDFGFLIDPRPLLTGER